jgi:hypothetical protein
VLAREMPFELGHPGWHAVVVALLAMHQLGLCAAPSALQPPVSTAGGTVSGSTGATAGQDHPGSSVRGESGSYDGHGLALQPSVSAAGGDGSGSIGATGTQEDQRSSGGAESGRDGAGSRAPEAQNDLGRSGGEDSGSYGASDAESGTTTPKTKLRAEAIERAAELIERAISSTAQPSPLPSPLDPLWMRQRSCAAALELAHPSSLLSCVAGLPSASLAALLGALFQAVDESVILSLRNPHAGSLPAASVIQLLGEVLCGTSGGARTIPKGATAAAIDRCQRVLATPQCPLPVHHAAGRVLLLLRRDREWPQGAPASGQTPIPLGGRQGAPPNGQAPIPSGGATRAAPWPRQQEQTTTPWQQPQQPQRAPDRPRSRLPLDFPPQI